MSERVERDFNNPKNTEPISRDKALISWVIISLVISPLVTWIIGIITLFRQKDTLGLGGVAIIGIGSITWIIWIIIFALLL